MDHQPLNGVLQRISDLEDSTVYIVPVKGEATVQVISPVNGEVLVGFDSIYQMHGIKVGEVFYTKIVNTEGKRCLFCLAVPWTHKRMEANVDPYHLGLRGLLDYLERLELVNSLQKQVQQESQNAQQQH